MKTKKDNIMTLSEYKKFPLKTSPSPKEEIGYQFVTSMRDVKVGDMITYVEVVKSEKHHFKYEIQLGVIIDG